MELAMIKFKDAIKITKVNKKIDLPNSLVTRIIVLLWMKDGKLGYIVSNEGKLLDINKILAIKDMPPQKNPQDIQVSNGVV